MHCLLKSQYNLKDQISRFWNNTRKVQLSKVDHTIFYSYKKDWHYLTWWILPAEAPKLWNLHIYTIEQCALPVTTIMALWQLVNLGTRCTIMYTYAPTKPVVIYPPFCSTVDCYQYKQEMLSIESWGSFSVCKPKNQLYLFTLTSSMSHIKCQTNVSTAK